MFRTISNLPSPISATESSVTALINELGRTLKLQRGQPKRIDFATDVLLRYQARDFLK